MSLNYANLSKERHNTKTYGDGMMQAYAGMCQKSGNEVPAKVMGKNGIEHKLWIVLAPSCAMEYANDARYLPGDTFLGIEKLKLSKENNVQYL